LILPGVLSGAMLAFIVSLDDFVITFLWPVPVPPRCRCTSSA
jgi:ABC-type spermidine/putrescine transport system permease subunit II